MSTLLPILGFALLFVAYGLFRPKHDCGGQCGSCEGEATCAYTESQDESR